MVSGLFLLRPGTGHSLWNQVSDHDPADTCCLSPGQGVCNACERSSEAASFAGENAASWWKRWLRWFKRRFKWIGGVGVGCEALTRHRAGWPVRCALFGGCVSTWRQWDGHRHAPLPPWCRGLASSLVTSGGCAKRVLSIEGGGEGEGYF